MATKKGWGFDVKELDDSIRPQDDFYHFVNKKWIDANPIPASESRWGSFVELRLRVDKQLRTILTELETTKNLVSGTPERMIRDFYRSGVDMKKRDALDAKPLEPMRKKIRSIKDLTGMQTVITEMHRTGASALWGSMIDQDSKNTQRYVLHFGQDGLGMPDREYYLKDDAESVRVRTAYMKHIENLFKLIGRTSAEAKREMRVIMDIETKLAHASMKKEDMREPEKTYHKMSVAQIQKLAPNIDWKRYLVSSDMKDVRDVIVMQPEFLSAVSGLLNSVSIEDWKTYLEWHYANDFSGLLSSRFIRESFSFYGTVLSGTKVMKPLWRRILSSVQGSLGEPLGQIYVKRHFSPEAKKRMKIMVEDLFVAFEARIKSLDWMTPTTKKKALLKLRAFNPKIGYPDKWRSYRGLKIVQDDYVGNVIRANLFEHKRAVQKLSKPIDRTEWHMFPQTVNAYFSPVMNDIVFPAGILQPPFFIPDGDDALNYGAMGAVIGHEMTHGFDDEGSQYDHKGNLKSWWTPEDRKRFEAKAKKVEKQFDQYTVADGLKVNGKLTLGENIADLGGLSIAYDALQYRLEKKGRTDLDGYTPEQRFFLGFAVFEREHSRPEFQKTQVLNDPHSPGIFRINGPASNLDIFYEAYGVKKGDTHYRASSEREKVW
jgi:putative endopeptidase